MRRRLIAAASAACAVLVFAGPLQAGPQIKQVGMASWYKMGTRTANGEAYDPMGITAAHRSLPFNTKVRVTNASSGDSVVVRINDRGPFAKGRIIDLSQGAARAINLVRAGIAKVKIEVLGGAPAAQAEDGPAADHVDVASATIEPVKDEPPLRLKAERRIGSPSR